MRLITVDSTPVASSAKRVGYLADEWRPIIAVGVAPNTIKLPRRLVDVLAFVGFVGLCHLELTILSPQTTATMDSGSMPYCSGLKVTYPDLLPSFPRTTKEWI